MKNNISLVEAGRMSDKNKFDNARIGEHSSSQTYSPGGDNVSQKLFK